MQPRVDIETVSILASREELLETLRTAHYTTIPVTGADRDDVRGLIYARDVFLNASVPWTVLIRPARFVPEQVNLLQLMHHFQGHSTKLAIVVDEYGGVAGVVSLQDVLEQIVGDLAGASQPAEPAITEIDQEAFSVSGDASLREWIERSGLAEIEIDLEGVRFHTVAGLVLAKLGRLPTEGDTVRIGPFDLIVKKMNGRRIHRILTRRLPDETNDRPQAGEDGSEQPQ
jgi:CBS domain containing-hemolysin-like protein